MSVMDHIPKGKTTGIGSLPHHNIDAALDFAFSFDIPFLPQIPIRNPWEYSVPQALDGLPGIRVESDGSAHVDMTVWEGRARSFDEKLLHAFDRATESDAFEAFEPSPATSSSWQPFLWEVQERATKVAKIQIVGPLTAQWSLRSLEGGRLDEHPEVCAQIFRLILARGLAMSRRLKSLGVETIVYLDEPALFVLTPENPRHLLGLQELKLVISTLKKEGVAVGIHCCSNTQWPSVLALGIDFLSLDTHLSLGSLLLESEALGHFLKEGGRLSLGLVPTTEPGKINSRDAERLFLEVAQALESGLGPERGKAAFTDALYTPACGLALHTPRDAQNVLATLARGI